jgi:hypothetical protein
MGDGLMQISRELSDGGFGRPLAVNMNPLEQVQLDRRQLVRQDLNTPRDQFLTQPLVDLHSAKRYRCLSHVRNDPLLFLIRGLTASVNQRADELIHLIHIHTAGPMIGSGLYLQPDRRGMRHQPVHP